MVGEKANEVEFAPDARHLNLPIETAHGGRAVVAFEQPQFHVFFATHVAVRALDHGIQLRRVILGESDIDVEGAIVPAPAYSPI